jgi:hypothetical protein
MVVWPNITAFFRLLNESQPLILIMQSFRGKKNPIHRLSGQTLKRHRLAGGQCFAFCRLPGGHITGN